MFFFFAFSYSKWWDFKQSEFNNIYENSWDVPIYALCFSQSCPHCAGLPEQFQTFGNDTEADVITTAIDVSKSNTCATLGARYLPYFVFVRGMKKKYWLQPNFRCFLRWFQFIEDWTTPQVTQISTNSEMNSSIENTLNGGSTFYLQVQEENDPILSKFMNLSVKYRIFNCTFIYSFFEENSKVTQPILTIYKSPSCPFQIQTQLTIDNLETFISKHKFSSFHHFDKEELIELIQTSKDENKKVGFLMNDGQLNGTRQNLLSSLITQYCNKYNFGWAIINKEKSINNFLKVRERLNYYFSILDPSSRCVELSPNSFENLSQIDQVFQKISKPSDQCTKFFIKRKILEESIAQSREQNSYHNILKISLFATCILMSIIIIYSIIKFWPFHPSKIE